MMNEIKDVTEIETAPKSTKWHTWLSTRVNWITVSFAGALYIAMGLMQVKGGQLALNDFSEYTWLDWIIWTILTFIPAILSLTVIWSMEKEALRLAKTEAPLKDLIEVYFSYLKNDPSSMKPRSESEYIKAGLLKDSSKKFTQSLLISFVTGQLIYSWSADSLLKIIINLSMWAYFGFNKFGQAYNYANSELRSWYILEIERLKSLEKENMISSGKYLDYTKEVK